MKDTDRVYLKSNVVAEPLINRWYAWAHLISPATSAMNMLNRCIKIMDSYIEAPVLHQEAVKDINMLGGPFMDYGTNRVEEIISLKENMFRESFQMIALAHALKDLDQMLRENALGYSLEILYSKVPDVLKGYVELFYDLNNSPSYRFYESLLYRSPYYKESLQSMFFYVTNSDNRTFILSTPRLNEEYALDLPLSFKDSRLDELFKMQRVSQEYGYIRKLFEIKPENENTFETFFTHEAPLSYQHYTGSGIRARYFGHACILLETNNVSILSDPVISYGYNSDVSRLTYTDLPETIDFVVITHNHQDHVLIETMLQLRHKIKTIIVPRNGSGELQDPSLKLVFQNLGFKNVYEMDELAQIEVHSCVITGIPFIGEHCDLNIRSKMCYHVKIDGFSLLLAADCCNIEPTLFKHVHGITGDIDVVFLGMECDGAPLTWMYGALLTKEISRGQDFSRRLTGSNYERAIDLVNRFNPSEVYVYAMGMEPWLKYIMCLNHTDESYPITESNKLIRECRSRGIISERLFGEKEMLHQREPEEANTINIHSK